MGYFASLITHSGLRQATPIRVRRVLALEHDEVRSAPPASQTVSVQTPLPTSLPGRAITDPSISSSKNLLTADSAIEQPSATRSATHRPLSLETDLLANILLPEFSRSGVLPASGNQVPSFVIPTPDEQATVRIGPHASDPARPAQPVTMEDVRTWVAAPLRDDASAPGHPLAPKNAEARVALQENVQTTQEVSSIEIGTIQIVIEESRLPPPPARQQRASEPSSASWTLPSRHYVRP